MAMIKFSKMHGCGNDFMLIDAVRQTVVLTPDLIRHWANRHYGIGFDQLLLVESALNPQALFRYRIFNADGSEVEQCGNGARCLAVFIRRQGLTQQASFWVETEAGLLLNLKCYDDQVAVEMGFPKTLLVDMYADLTAARPQYEIRVGERWLNFFPISMGNPHCVIFLSDIQTVDMDSIVTAVATIFPQGINIGIAEIISPQAIRLRVHERGVGETLACGSGACAAVVAGIRQQLLADTIAVELAGGSVVVTWKGEQHPVILIGPAVHVFDGVISQ